MARLAIIGAGPKAAAIAAKAAALQAVGHPKPIPDIHIYDPNSVGAAWRGTHGYTDGEQPLCTLAERDLGFPYDTVPTWGPAVAKAMATDFSWQSFAINSAGSRRYHTWVVNGRRPPRHDHFADYLKYAVTKAETQGAASLIEAKVTAVDFVNGMWWIESTDSSGTTTSNDYDGVVITGNGRPRRLSGANRRVFDGYTFWLPGSSQQMANLLSADRLNRLEPSVLIIGAGGTAAAIAYWFLRRGGTGLRTVPITIVGREATLFARHEGPFEDRLFTDETAWGALIPHVRQQFLDRTTAGVVWDYVLRNLVSDNITYECYDARKFVNVGPHPGGPGQPDRLELELDASPDPVLAKARDLLNQHGISLPPPIGAPPTPQTVRRSASVFIDARGFDRFGFVDDLFAKSPLRPFFITEAAQRQIPLDIRYHLDVGGTFAGADFPHGLHVPGLGAMQGPASANLMGLGWLADRVLGRYC